jgi:hypothetical protein
MNIPKWEGKAMMNKTSSQTQLVDCGSKRDGQQQSKV